MAREVILGLHGFSSDSPRLMHDAGVCILIDGEVAAAIDEERLSRAKRDGNFPMRAYRTALEVAGVGPEEIDAVAFVDRRTLWQTFWVWRYALSALLQTGVQLWRYLAWWTRQMFEFRRIPPPDVLTRDWRFFEHHRCHAASAYYPSPWDRATVVTLDGMGDFSIGGSVSRGADGHLELYRRTNGYFSPGHFYMIVTDYLGFTPGRHEGKVMGLAAHGDPKKAYETMERIISYRPEKMDFAAGPVAEEFFNVIRSGSGTRTREWYAQHDWEHTTANPRPQAYRYDGQGLRLFRRLWGGFTREDVAAAAQRRFEDIVSEFVRDAVRLVGDRHLVVAGGCFGNVQLNRRLRELPEVDEVYIHPNMSDGGLSLGAALLLHNERRERAGRRYVHRPLENVYLGPAYPDDRIETALRARGLVYRKVFDLVEQTAQALAAGKAVAWFHGRMEYGPRALGNRSLLVAATDPETHQRLNSRLGRSEIMPFAPIILEEDAGRWLKSWNPDHLPSRFMTMTYVVDEELARHVPAVVHVDGTVRPQVLRREDQPSLHQVLLRYRELTGLPLVINTSFNMHEEPIVCSPEDAIETFCRGAADVMAIGSFWIDGTVAEGIQIVGQTDASQRYGVECVPIDDPIDGVCGVDLESGSGRLVHRFRERAG